MQRLGIPSIFVSLARCRFNRPLVVRSFKVCRLYSTKEASPMVSKRIKVVSPIAQVNAKIGNTDGQLSKDDIVELRNHMSYWKKPTAFDSFILCHCHVRDFLRSGITYLTYLVDQNLMSAGAFVYGTTVLEKMFKSYGIKNVCEVAEKMLQLSESHPSFKEIHEPIGYSLKVLLTCMSRNWVQSVPLLKDTNMKWRVSSCTDLIIRRALGDKDMDIVWDLVKTDKRISADNQLGILDVCHSLALSKDYQSTIENVDKYLEIMARNQRFLDRPTAIKLKDVSKLLPLTTTSTTIVSNGTCRNCGTEMKKTDELTWDDFDILKTAVVNHLLYGQNIYESSTPAELDKFLRFLGEQKPFDIVVDGLNLLYKNNLNNTKWMKKWAKLAHVVQDLHMRHNFNRILVVGRDADFRGNHRKANKLANYTTFYTVQRESSDDLFSLYSALHSGPNCWFFSGDQLQNYIHALTEKGAKQESQLLSAWVRKRKISHQETIEDGVVYKFPETWCVWPHKDTDGWHVPCEYQRYPVANTLPTSWLCIRKK